MSTSAKPSRLAPGTRGRAWCASLQWMCQSEGIRGQRSLRAREIGCKPLTACFPGNRLFFKLAALVQRCSAPSHICKQLIAQTDMVHEQSTRLVAVTRDDGVNSR